MSEFLISDFTVISTWEAFVAELETIRKKWTGESWRTKVDYKDASLILHFVIEARTIPVLSGVPRFSIATEGETTYIQRAFGMERFVVMCCGDTLVSLATARLFLSAMAMAMPKDLAVFVEYGEGHLMGLDAVNRYSLNSNIRTETHSSLMRQIVTKHFRGVSRKELMAAYSITLMRRPLPAIKQDTIEPFELPWGCDASIESIELQCIFPQVEVGLAIAGLLPDPEQAPIWMLSVGKRANQPTKLCQLILDLALLLRQANAPPGTETGTIHNKTRIHSSTVSGGHFDWSAHIRHIFGGHDSEGKNHNHSHSFVERMTKCLIHALLEHAVFSKKAFMSSFVSLWTVFVATLRDYWLNMELFGNLDENSTMLERKLTLLNFCIKREIEYGKIPGCMPRKSAGAHVGSLLDSLSAKHQQDVAQKRSEKLSNLKNKLGVEKISRLVTERIKQRSPSLAEEEEFFDAKEFSMIDEALAEETIELLKTQLESEFEEDGRKIPLEGVFILNTQEQLWVPFTQEACLLLEDVDVATRNRQQCAFLVADMQAFKAANPSAVFVDFIRWHSPRDYREGSLSARMSSPDNLWQALWDACVPLPLVKQKLVFDHRREAESILGWLEDIPLIDLLNS